MKCIATLNQFQVKFTLDIICSRHYFFFLKALNIFLIHFFPFIFVESLATSYRHNDYGNGIFFATPSGIN
jgi:hypothetical protein